MEKPSSKTIEVTVISAESLRVNKKTSVKKTVSVTLKADPFHSGLTAIDPDGGSCPAWNEKLVMELPVHAGSGSRVIATASIPVSDFTSGHLPENYLSFLSYSLKDGSGGKNEIINLSVKVKGAGNTGCAASCSRPWMGVPAADGKIVIGIPIQ